jgi:hypothetical protein
MRGHGEHSGSSVGLTDHTTPDLYGSVAPLPNCPEYAGKEVKGLSGVWGRAPGLSRP